jgi:hypothetical protein
MMHSIIICIISIIGTLRLLFGAFITDPKICVIIADPFYLIGDRVLLNITLAAFAIACVQTRMIFLSSKYKNLNYLSYSLISRLIVLNKNLTKIFSKWTFFIQKINE